MKLKGRVWKFGDDVNTDLIIPGKYLELTEPTEMARHAMEGIDPTFHERVGVGDIVVAGRNFGCGSSREHAPLALKYAGVGAVISESYARIFYRNAINIGLPALECPGVADAVDDGDVLEIDLNSGIVEVIGKEVRLQFTPLPEFMVGVLNEGGLTAYLRKHMDEW
jgi:3-isopropylmalate/(R)-2-methylmalate dehydratase small subunit